MLYQLAFTELFLNKLWPDLNNNDLDNIFIKFHKIKENLVSKYRYIPAIFIVFF